MKFENSGYRFMKAAPNAHTYKASSNLKSSSLPSSVDLRPYMTTVENQGRTSSCTANAVAGACEYLIKKHGESRFFDVSRLFVYYNARWRREEQDKDCGSVIQFAIESLKKFGVCSEKTWSFDTANVLQKPSDRAYQEAARFTISDFQKVELDLDLWRKCLAEGYPIVFGCALFKTFDECNKRGGIVAMPSPEDTTRGSHGAHAMLCVGYSDVDKLFIVRNSWGADWGDRGYCYMPYSYLINPKFNFGDCWIVKSTDKIPDPQETWNNKKTTIINDGEGFDWYDADEYNYYNDDDYSDFELDAIIAEIVDGDGEYEEFAPEDYEETEFEAMSDEEFEAEFGEEGDFDEEEEEFDEEEGEFDEADSEIDEEEEEFDEEDSEEEEEEFDEEESEEEEFEEEEPEEEEFEEEEPEEEEEFEEEEPEEEEFEEEEPEEDFEEEESEEESSDEEEE